MKQDNIVLEKSKAFALRIIKLYNYLYEEKRAYVLANQVMKSGTSIGANIREARCAQGTADFYAKMCISYKESEETAYWLELLHESGYIENEAFESIYADCMELVKLLSSITKQIKQA